MSLNYRPRMTLNEKIGFFFKSPAAVAEPGTMSSLLMLRREVQFCLIGDLAEEDAVIDIAMAKGEYRLFATLMVLAASVDLLAKFYAGSDDVRNVGARIKGFAARYMFGGAKDPDRSALAFYTGLRNPLLHSFTLYDRKVEIWFVNRQPTFDIFENGEKPDHFLISVEGIYQAFVRGIRLYYAELITRSDLRHKFEAMYERYGTTGFGVMPE